MNRDYRVDRVDLNDPLLVYDANSPAETVTQTTLNSGGNGDLPQNGSFTSPSILRIVSKPISRCSIFSIYTIAFLNLMFSVMFYIYPLYYKILVPSLSVILIIQLIAITKQIHNYIKPTLIFNLFYLFVSCIYLSLFSIDYYNKCYKEINLADRKFDDGTYFRCDSKQKLYVLIYIIGSGLGLVLQILFIILLFAVKNRLARRFTVEMVDFGCMTISYIIAVLCSVAIVTSAVYTSVHFNIHVYSDSTCPAINNNLSPFNKYSLVLENSELYFPQAETNDLGCCQFISSMDSGTCCQQSICSRKPDYLQFINSSSPYYNSEKCEEYLEFLSCATCNIYSGYFAANSSLVNTIAYSYDSHSNVTTSIYTGITICPSFCTNIATTCTGLKQNTAQWCTQNLFVNVAQNTTKYCYSSSYRNSQFSRVISSLLLLAVFFSRL